MDASLFSALLLAIIQGITEWFPVSSSSHLIIASKLLDYDNTLAFDVALHFGTLMAVFVYFGKDITDIIRDFMLGKWKSENGRLGVLLIIATIPALVLGFFLRKIVEQSINNFGLIALGLGITSVLLLIASLDYGRKNKGSLNYKSALFIGIAQAFSIFRGISRTGTTVSSGLLLGLDEKTAVKFSFLLSIPVVFGANILSLGNNSIPKEFFFPALLAFFVGIAMINLSYKYVLANRKNLRWFALYVLLLALGIGIWVVFF